MYKIIPVEKFDLVLFGATGDLARREIIPGLFRRFKVGQMPKGSRIVAVARKKLSDADYRHLARSAISANVEDGTGHLGELEAFLACLSYCSIDVRTGIGWNELGKKIGPDVITAFYLSLSPSVFGDIVRNLHNRKLVTPNSRIVVEKPFGHDLESARALNTKLRSAFMEKQVYRIDHYLGKETVQNLMALRFANVLFEPLWNSQYIDHVQITVAEKTGVKGRGEYYDSTGAMRDMVQNHLMQLLCLTAMEPPFNFEPNAVRDEKLKVIRALEPVNPDSIMLGQYGSGPAAESYLSDIDASASTTESFVALKCGIANWRWAGTPFYLRTGKRLRARMSEIAVVFRNPPHSIFGSHNRLQGNVLAIRLQPNEGIKMRVTIKEPGPGGMRLVEVPLDMSFADTLDPSVSELTRAYERLIMDVIRGNQTLFMRDDEVEAAWQWTDRVIEDWSNAGKQPILYESGSAGPEDALGLLYKEQRKWRGLEQ